MERLQALIQLLEHLWQRGEPIGPVDIQVALTALDTGRSDQHRSMGLQVLATSVTGRPLWVDACFLALESEPGTPSLLINRDAIAMLRPLA